MIIARPGAIDRFVIVIVIVIVIASLRRPHCNSLQLVQPSEPLHSRGAVVEERDRRRIRVHAEKAPVGAAVAPFELGVARDVDVLARAPPWYPRDLALHHRGFAGGLDRVAGVDRDLARERE